MRAGGTGIGLADMRKLVDQQGGAVMMNNVFNDDPKKEGVCVTVVFPGGQEFENGDSTLGLQQALRKLKELLQSGEYCLPKIRQKAV
jgi:hypothetical protein